MARAGEHFERVEVAGRNELRRWLTAHHERTEGAWLVTWKRPDPRFLPYDDIVEELLCFGWVDSLPRKLDDRRSMLLISPRKPGSGWSKLNKERAERLIAQGLMMASGSQKIEQAKASGHWTKLDSIEVLEIPSDLLQAFEAYPSALANWHAFPPSARRGILEWIIQAKKPETRARRIDETAQKAGRNERANQWRK